MKKIKEILQLLKKIDLKNMGKIIGNLSQKSKKSRLLIFLDMIYCAFKYGTGYYDYQEFEFYLLSAKERKTYLTRVKNNLIVATYNDRTYFKYFDNKELFNQKFKKYLNRQYLIINKNSYDKFVNFLKKHQQIIVKPIEGEGGVGVEKITYESKAILDVLFKEIINNNQLLIEEYITQHSLINSLYDGSVNSLRLVTFYDGKKVSIINSVFKIGNGGVTDNFSSGSMYTFVDNNGKIIAPAIDKNDKIYEYHPLTNVKIKGFKVPFYKEACKLVQEAAKIIPEVKYVGWDIAITDKRPILIEGNCFPGVYQLKPSLSKKHAGLIPSYEKVMKL